MLSSSTRIASIRELISALALNLSGRSLHLLEASNSFSLEILKSDMKAFVFQLFSEFSILQKKSNRYMSRTSEYISNSFI